MKPKYITCSESELNVFYAKGYEYLAVVLDTFENSHNSSSGGYINTTSVNISIPVTQRQTNVRFLMQLTKLGQVLEGAKREDNT